MKGSREQMSWLPWPSIFSVPHLLQISEILLEKREAAGIRGMARIQSRWPG